MSLLNILTAVVRIKTLPVAGHQSPVNDFINSYSNSVVDDKLTLAGKLWNPLTTQVRYANRPNFKLPGSRKFIPLHYKRVRMLAVVKPRYPEPAYPCENPKYKKGERAIKKFEDNPYAVFMAKRMIRNFEGSSMIAIFHRNSYTAHQFLAFRGQLFDADFDMLVDQWISRKVATNALTGTKWAPVLPLIVSSTVIGYCRSTNLEKLNKILKKMPGLVLLGVIVENKLMNRVDYEAYLKLRDIGVVRAQLCHTLNIASASVQRTLGANQIALTSNLAAYSSQKPGDTNNVTNLKVQGDESH